MITMNTKGLMAGMWLAILILTTTGTALDAPFNAAFSTVYGQVTDSGAGVNGVYVSLAANGVTLTTVTTTNNRGEPGFYIFELANIPKVTDTTPLILSTRIGAKTAITTITGSGNALQKVDLAVQTPVLTTINVIPITTSVFEDTTSTFAAVTSDQFGAPIDAVVTWSSSNTNVVAINSSTGVFIALKAGTTVITAADGNVRGNATLTVRAIPVLSTIKVSPQIASVVTGNTRTFSAATLTQFGKPIAAAVIWNSSNQTVGTVDQVTGVFTALAIGTTSVNATNGTVIGRAAVTVTLPQGAASITGFSTGNGTRGSQITARVNITNLGAALQSYVIVVSGVSPQGYPLAGTGTLTLAAGQSMDNVPVLVSIPPVTPVGGYSLIAGIYKLETFPNGLITAKGPLTAEVS